MTTCAFLHGGKASPAVTEAVKQALRKYAPQVTFPIAEHVSEFAAMHAAAKGLAVGCGITAEDLSGCGFHSAVSTPSVCMSPDYDTARCQPVIVRALGTSGPDRTAIRDIDRVDVFAAQGVDTTRLERRLTQTFQDTAAEALAMAQARKAQKVTLALKNVSRSEKLNKLFAAAAHNVFAGTPSIALETATTGAVLNNMVMFPESVGIVLANDVESSDVMSDVLGGLSGGAGVSFVEYRGKRGSAFIGAAHDANPSGTLFALSAALNKAGLRDESAKLKKALESALKNSAQRTVDLDGGKLDTAAFTKVVLA